MCFFCIKATPPQISSIKRLLALLKTQPCNCAKCKAAGDNAPEPLGEASAGHGQGIEGMELAIVGQDALVAASTIGDCDFFETCLADLKSVISDFDNPVPKAFML